MHRDPRPWEAIAARGNLAVLLVRHGQTAYNRERRFLGVTDVPLDDVGRVQAQQLSTALGGGVDRAITSPLSRARQTAAALDPGAEVVDALREMDQGDLEGMGAAEAFRCFPDFFAAWAQDPGTTAPPRGEGIAAVQERVLGALWNLARVESRGRVVAAFSHQLAIASALCGLTGTPLRRWQDHRLQNCGVSVLEFDGRTWKVVEHGWSVGNLRIVSGSKLPGM